SNVLKINPLKIGYISLVFNSSLGVFRKLEEQAKAAQKLSLPLSVVWITTEHNEMAKASKNVDVRLISHSNNFQFRVKQVQELNKCASKYDVVFVRYPMMDPVIYTLCFPNTIGITE